MPQAEPGIQQQTGAAFTPLRGRALWSWTFLQTPCSAAVACPPAPHLQSHSLLCLQRQTHHHFWTCRNCRSRYRTAALRPLPLPCVLHLCLLLSCASSQRVPSEQAQLRACLRPAGHKECHWHRKLHRRCSKQHSAAAPHHLPCACRHALWRSTSAVTESTVASK